MVSDAVCNAPGPGNISRYFGRDRWLALIVAAYLFATGDGNFIGGSRAARARAVSKKIMLAKRLLAEWFSGHRAHVATLG